LQKNALTLTTLSHNLAQLQLFFSYLIDQNQPLDVDAEEALYALAIL
jgi:hypothetical protein